MDLCDCSGKQWSREELVFWEDSGLAEMATEGCVHLPKAIGHGLNQSFSFTPLLSSFGHLYLVCIWASEIPASSKGSLGRGCHQTYLRDFQWDEGRPQTKWPLTWASMLLAVLGYSFTYFCGEGSNLRKRKRSKFRVRTMYNIGVVICK